MKKWQYAILALIVTAIYMTVAHLAPGALRGLVGAMSLASALTIYLNLNKSNALIGVNKMLFVAAISYGVLKLIAQLIFMYNGLEDQSSTEFYIAYFVQSVVVFAAYVRLLYMTTKRWEKRQMVLDIAMLVYYFSGLYLSILVNNNVFHGMILIEMIALSAFNITFVGMVIILILLSVSQWQDKKSYLIGYIMAGIFYALSEGIPYMFSIFGWAYNTHVMVLLRVMSMIRFASIVYFGEATLTADALQRDRMMEPQNYGKISQTWLIVILPTVALVAGLLTLEQYAVFIVGLILYQIASYSLQHHTKTRVIINREAELNQQLEQEVDKRTIALQHINDALVLRAKSDALTGMYNRNHFFALVDEWITAGTPFTLLYIDLDRFKIINDIHGHAVGDEVLIRLAKRLEHHSVGNGEMGRIGGDEFACMTKITEPSQLEKFCEGILAAVEQPLSIQALKFSVGVSIGIAKYPDDADNGHDLLKNADIAMYHAKSTFYTKKYVHYSERLMHTLERRNRIEQLLKNIDFKREFTLYYQPIIRMEDYSVVGFEALLRWKHPELGFIPPAEFIPVAEEIGIIFEISKWVFVQAMTQIKIWNESYRKRLKVAINLSPVILNLVEFLPCFKRILNSLELDPALVELEISENQAMVSSRFLAGALKRLRSLGVSLSIDDFGTGYSSLSSLKEFDINTLKIANELIENIENDNDDLLIVKAIVLMAEGLGLDVIAEGVETEGQLSLLRSINCGRLQGYVFDQAMPPQEIELRYLSIINDLNVDEGKIRQVRQRVRDTQ